LSKQSWRAEHADTASMFREFPKRRNEKNSIKRETASAGTSVGDGAVASIHNGLKQRMIGERFGGLGDGLMSRDRRAIREKIEIEPAIRNWFQDLASVSN
jgi:hypothetical protein